ncbi:MAG: hypothetical protein IJU19_00805 [Bacteroidales bacterium]|nr:hypothetical protein [Bacteroidales bacterium]
MHTEIDKQVTRRFFQALETLIARKDIESVQSYCTDGGFDSRNIYSLRKDNATHMFHFDWLQPLIMNYGVSALWLLTGLGDMLHPMYLKAEK